MTCELCHGVSAVSVVTEDGPAIRPCPWCRKPEEPSATQDPYRMTLEIARQVVADNPDASDDEIAREIYVRYRNMRRLVRRDDPDA